MFLFFPSPLLLMTESRLLPIHRKILLHHSFSTIQKIIVRNYYSRIIIIDFPYWRRSFLLIVSIKKKKEFLDGSISKPSIGDPLFLPWIRSNNMLVTWLLISVLPPVASIIFYFENAKQIWDKLHQGFSESNDSRVSHLQ